MMDFSPFVCNRLSRKWGIFERSSVSVEIVLSFYNASLSDMNMLCYRFKLSKTLYGSTFVLSRVLTPMVPLCELFTVSREISCDDSEIRLDMSDGCHLIIYQRRCRDMSFDSSSDMSFDMSFDRIDHENAKLLIIVSGLSEDYIAQMVGEYQLLSKTINNDIVFMCDITDDNFPYMEIISNLRGQDCSLIQSRIEYMNGYESCIEDIILGV